MQILKKRKLAKKFMLIWCFWLSASVFYGQFTPVISNFTEADYKAHHQNWAFTHSDDGWLYFGNSEGLLVHNGSNWFKFSFPGNTVRSLHFSKNRIYSGGYNEFGYWTKDECGNHRYTSLNHLIPSHLLAGEEIWNIVENDNKIYFQSFAIVLVYDGTKIKKLDTPGNIMFMQKVNDEIWLPVINDGIYILVGNDFVLIPETKILRNLIVTGISSYLNDNKSAIISTASGGIYLYSEGNLSRWSNRLNNDFSEVQINKLKKLKDGRILIGTIRSGLFILNKNLEFEYNININNGLINNTVLDIGDDVSGNIWLGLDKGISCIHINDNVTMLKDRLGVLGTLYCVEKLQNRIYIGTNQGLYYTDEAKNEFNLVKGTQGQVWQLYKIGEQLICGHNEGTFLISKDKMSKISNVTGGWYTQKVMNSEGLLIQGTYTGLVLFKIKNQIPYFSHVVDNFRGPVKKLIQTGPFEFWITSHQLGLKRILMNSDFTKVIKEKDYNNHFKNNNPGKLEINYYKNKLLVSLGGKFYYYDEKTDKFYSDNEFDQTNGSFLIRIPNDSVMVRLYDEEIDLRFGKSYVNKFKIYANKDYHSVSIFEYDKVGICATDGFYVFATNKSPKVQLNNTIKFYKLTFKNSNECYTLKNHLSKEVPYKDRRIKLYFQSVNYKKERDLKFKVSPGSDKWTPINNSDFVYLDNLSFGEYKIMISDGSSNDHVTIRIGVPFYLQWWAFVLYALILWGIIKFGKFYFNKQVKIQEERIIAENERMFREKMIQIENESLMKENLSKTMDLANATNALVKKNELLLEIKKEIIDIKKSGDQKITGKDYETFMKQINDNLTLNEDKRLFDLNFEEVHRDFMIKLKNDFPNLSGDDLQLAAYLRMNLSSKEIAPLFNISLRGLENKRYRLRKKMQLSNDLDLNDYFLSYT